MTASVKEADELIELAESRGLTLMSTTRFSTRVRAENEAADRRPYDRHAAVL